ncbi:MAG: glycosyltransferase family 39 protein [Anaerolineae bacterium]|jgi:4-amino-4-deoxy-L-arabinose transferase-like glycosyltransferase
MSGNWRWAFVVVLLLLAWGLRLCCLEEVPPGWRDDELINIHALSSQLLEGHFPIYYLGASGHEPLYHHLHAAVHAVVGFNVLSGHILSVFFGMLSIALTYSVARQLFPTDPATAALAAMTLATSFWSLMYSRTAVRHISLPPLALTTLYTFWRQTKATKATVWGWGLVGLLLGATLYTYTASRLLPVLLAIFIGYLALFHRERFRGQWRGFAVASVVVALSAAPLAFAIVQGRTVSAIEGIGADARVTELAGPLRDLRSGNLRPVLTSIAKTLGMFHATGDPEWLYNISGRPVFNLLGGILLWAGVALCLCRWRQPRYFLLLTWLGLGLSPAFVSTPPASLGHTILAQPVAYILSAVALVEICHRQSGWLRSRGTWVTTYLLLFAVFVASNAIRDLRDYFQIWPEQEMVRVLYRADYRETGQYLNDHRQIKDVAVASTLLGPWDRLALEVDTRRRDIDVRLFDPGRSLVWTGEGQRSAVILTAWPPASPIIREMLLLHATMSEPLSSDLTLYDISALGDFQRTTDDPHFLPLKNDSMGQRWHQFNNGLALTEAYWLNPDALTSGNEAELVTAWVLTGPIDLPPIPIVANPPPPGVRTGPRLAVFAHLLASDAQSEELNQDTSVLAVDDGLWVDPLTLQPGDRFVQIHRFLVQDDAAVESYEVELGLYDPLTGERCVVLDGEGSPADDHVRIRNEDLAPTVSE